MQSFLEEIRSDDLRKIFDSGLLVNAELDTSSLADFIPESLPNAEMKVIITLPDWVRVRMIQEPLPSTSPAKTSALLTG